jgi:hypothetical protein
LPARVTVARSEDTDGRKPIPDAAAQKQAMQRVHEVFADEYGRRSEDDRRKLAGELIAQSGDSSDDPAIQYVMLSDAWDLAVEGGDYPLACEAIDALAELFVINPAPLKLSALTKVSRNARKNDAEAIVQDYGEIVDQAIAEGDPATATNAATQADQFARKYKDMGIVAKAQRMAAKARDAQQQQKSIADAMKKLESDPNDAAANLAVGKFRCLIANEWAEGLPLLAKGSDEALKKAATDDLADPSDPSDQVKVGDAWWSVGEKESSDSFKASLRRRAGVWYERALPELSGLKRTAVEKRLATLEPPTAPETATNQKPRLSITSGARRTSSGDGGSGQGSDNPFQQRSNRESGGGNTGRLRSLEDFYSSMPAKFIPQPGKHNSDQSEFNEWVQANVKGKSFELDLKISNVYLRQRGESDAEEGRSYITFMFQPEPVVKDGLRASSYFNCRVYDDATIARLIRLFNNDIVRVKGTIDRGTGHGYSQNSGSRGLQFQFYVRDATYTLIGSQ